MIGFTSALRKTVSTDDVFNYLGIEVRVVENGGLGMKTRDRWYPSIPPLCILGRIGCTHGSSGTIGLSV